MPNWCNNYIEICGPTDKVKSLWKKAQHNWENDSYGLLHAMVPMPEALQDTVSPSPKDGSQPLVDGFTNWHEWCVCNWGTKWDINDSLDDIMDHGNGTSTISGWFDTAWSPPVAAYNNFLAKNEDIQIYATYEESGMDYAGIYDNGEDEFLEDVFSTCEEVSSGKVPLEKQSELFQKLDKKLELVESYLASLE